MKIQDNPDFPIEKYKYKNRKIQLIFSSFSTDFYFNFPHGIKLFGLKRIFYCDKFD
jgi:hypothetical protein